MGNPVASRQSRTALRFSVGLCFLSALCEGFDVQAAGVAAPGITRELHCTPADLGLFFSASGLGLMIGSVIGGRISDRRGRKLVLVASIGVFGAFFTADSRHAESAASRGYAIPDWLRARWRTESDCVGRRDQRTRRSQSQRGNRLRRDADRGLAGQRRF
jgi:hypothetical protein